ncbi:hypothetical protein QN277_016189 [Acacia crassicarpa]|uniref:Uncharacterized protein n=1 Tax=Acacia crassicarpa TaxID=499986 RepID=A0AAE1TBW4_9FABA|nr:hypothetical protein QN277_016189 [Acacia crassicarpa]
MYHKEKLAANLNDSVHGTIDLCDSIHGVVNLFIFPPFSPKPKQWDEESTSGASVFEEESLFISPCLRVSDFLSAQSEGEEELIQDDERGAL